ncbi:ATP-binding cassette (ABC) Superfamily [Phytophthora palmivora]|uniref:ATP-binding cassette (ABC) Superfamily n=1 Tax=Phytophthora palmivora TaxID=4796 RepID=A0A2P4YG02_9STRA|nr:ATP-binding cassette (ABC) Superfamily [Phytophthora palmivora]
MPRFAYRGHSPGAESPVFDIPMITGSESDEDTTGYTKDPTHAQDALSQDAPVGDLEAKTVPTSLPAKNLTLDEGKVRAQAAKPASQKRADEGAAAAKKRAAPGSPTQEEAVSEPQEVSNDLDEQQERYQTAQLQGASAPPPPVHPHGYYPPDAGSGPPMSLEHLKVPRGLNHGRTSRGVYERALVQDEPRFVNGIETARCVLLAPHRIPLKDFTSLQKNRKTVPENTTNQTQAEDLFWRWISLKNFTVQELKEHREDRLLSYVLDQRDLRIESQLHSDTEGIRQQSKSSAQDERGYGSVNPGTVHRKAAKKPRTTYAPAVADPKSQQPSGSQPGAGLPAPTSSSAAALGRLAPHGRGALCSNQGGREELSHAFEYEAPSQPYPSGPSTSGRDSVGSLLSDEVRQLRDRVYAIEIALGLGPGGQAAAQAGKPGAIEIWMLLRLMSSMGALTAEFRLLP